VADSLIALGRLVNVHATRGELRLLLYNPDSHTLARGTQVTLRRGNEEIRSEIVALRPHKRFLLVTLRGCDSMSAAEHLVGMELLVPDSQLPPLKENEVYHYQLVGMRVEDEVGADIGVVEKVMPLPGADVCVVRSPTGKEHLIPMVGHFVKKLDREGRRLVIRPVPGLLDL